MWKEECFIWGVRILKNNKNTVDTSQLLALSSHSMLRNIRKNISVENAFISRIVSVFNILNIVQNLQSPWIYHIKILLILIYASNLIKAFFNSFLFILSIHYLTSLRNTTWKVLFTKSLEFCTVPIKNNIEWKREAKYNLPGLFLHVDPFRPVQVGLFKIITLERSGGFCVGFYSPDKYMNRGREEGLYLLH